MKKFFLISGIIFIVLLVLSLYVFSKDNIKFKFSYEMVNTTEYSNGKRIKVNIPFDNRVKYLNTSEIVDLIKNGTGVLYLGYNTCPWCRNAVPVLIDAVIDNDINYLYYGDIHQIDTTEIDELLVDYYREDDEGNKRLSVPDVYFIKDGEIIGHHIGTVESYRNPFNGMSDSEKEELKNIYSEFIKEIK